MAAGLGVYVSTGRVIDRFRDRLVFPIHGTDGEIHGFIGRRNPDHEEAGPKYLNTAGNDLFSKGDQLFGIHEGRAELTAGATPVLVEGPVDAWAVTIAGEGRSVGVASLGTAFTDRQADQLRPYIGADRLFQDGIVPLSRVNIVDEQRAMEIDGVTDGEVSRICVWFGRGRSCRLGSCLLL